MKPLHCFVVAVLLSLPFALGAPASEPAMIRGLHLMAPKPADVALLVDFIGGDLVREQVNVLVLEVGYQYQFSSHPELAAANPIGREDARKILEACRKAGIRLIPSLNCLGHQSWAAKTFPLLTVYPQFDETPGKYAGNEGIYCRSYCPRHPEVHGYLFDLIDELSTVFEADAFHVGLDEAFILGDEDCPRCKGVPKAELFAEEVRRLHEHLKQKGLRMWMWGDRFLDGESSGIGKWEASTDGTAPAVDMVPKDIVICDWHYEFSPPTAGYFALKGFDVVLSPWRKRDVALNHLRQVMALRQDTRPVLAGRARGILHTTWTDPAQFIRAYRNEMLEGRAAAARSTASARESARTFKTLFAAARAMEQTDQQQHTTTTPSVFVPAADAILKTLKPGHPRLLASAADFDRLKERIGSDATARQWYEKLRGKAQQILAAEPSRYEIPDGLRLLATSRRVLDRVYTLALLYRLDKNNEYLARAWKELDAAAGFPDWNPRHFLDTAEMTHAFAIAYDWLYDQWTEPQRSRLRTAMIELGLKPAQAAYDGRSQYGTWVNAQHNWNQVCNGGIGIGALAIADEEPRLAGRVLHEALGRLPRAMVHYGPDGAWSEGPGYWHYATRYNVYILAALETALGHDFGLSDIRGFADAGTFPIYVTGPTGRTFNFADGGDNPIRAEEMFWLARRFDRPEYARYQAGRAEPNALDLLWYDAGLLQGPESKPPPLDRYFRGSEVVTMRTSWDDPEALFVAFKAGDNKANHSNLDIGSFVLESAGQRWVVDPGRDNYNLPGYWERGVEGRRWTYYRMRAESHNTLVLNPGKGPDQDPLAIARITDYSSTRGKTLAIADLTPAYSAHARSVRRAVLLLHGLSGSWPAVFIEDEISSEAPLDGWWFLHTPAAVEILESGRLAKLELGGKQLYVRLRGPEQAAFEVADAAPLASSPNPAGQAANPGIRRVAIHLQGVRDAKIVVEISRAIPEK